MLSALAGLGLGLSLIVAIGAQNVFVLRQGIRREHVIPVILICAISDAVLILAGVAGLGALISAAPWLVPVARWAGAAFLLVYGILAARRAWRGDSALPDTPARDTDPGAPAGTTRSTTTGLAATVTTALALTWLNPHVYLDTVLMLGSIAATHGAERWLFAAGAVTASILWFTALGFGARYLGRWLRSAFAWRILDAAIAVVMIVIAVSLVVPVLGG